jgi:penicillin amidase
VEGNIGYQTPGNIPIRVEGHDGLLPVPGWTGEYEWQGYIPFEELPYAFNPAQGYIVTANNAVVGPEYPYTISRLWDPGFRAQRIVDMIEASPGEIGVAYLQQMQGDDMDMLAEVLVPILMEVSMDDDQLVEARNQLQGWDYQMEIDSAPGVLYAIFWKHLQAATFDDDLPQPEAGGSRMEIIRHLVNEPNSSWWDDQTTPEVETRDDIFRLAFEAAYRELRKLQGKDAADWAWGDLHTLTFHHQVMSNFPLINKAFDRGPFPTAGGNSIVNATGWNPYESYEVNWLPSMRMIVDLSNLQNSWTVHTTGQSGHPYHHHYIDMADPWRLIEYHPQNWERAAIESDAEGHLRLVP